MSGQATAERYGRSHRQTRAEIGEWVLAGGVVCWRCGEEIRPGERWDLGHVDEIAQLDLVGRDFDAGVVTNGEVSQGMGHAWARSQERTGDQQAREAETTKPTTNRHGYSISFSARSATAALRR